MWWNDGGNEINTEHLNSINSDKKNPVLSEFFI